MSCIRLALNGVSGGSQLVCRISILIEEMLERVESLDTLDSTGMSWIGTGEVLERVVMPVGLECHE